MKLNSTARNFTIAALALGVAAGCASTAEQKPAEPVAEEEADKGAQAAEQAITMAKSMNESAAAAGYEWRDTGDIIKQAEEAADAGKYDQAIELANKAREQAENALNQKKLEQARLTYMELKDIDGLSAEQQAKLDELDRLIRSGDGVAAKEYADQLAAELESMRSADVVYEVVRGDSLWAISGKEEIYANPYQWPLIYKNNSDKIDDADLIYPGQEFDIDMDPSAAEVDAAVDHARTRGAWSIGVVEESDKAYLNR